MAELMVECAGIESKCAAVAILVLIVSPDIFLFLLKFSYMLINSQSGLGPPLYFPCEVGPAASLTVSAYVFTALLHCSFF